jgi:hypothetical protein
VGRSRDSFGIERLPSAQQQLLTSAFRATSKLVLQYQADLLEQPLDEVVRWRDEGMAGLRSRRTPYLSLHTHPSTTAIARGWSNACRRPRSSSGRSGTTSRTSPTRRGSRIW